MEAMVKERERTRIEEQKAKWTRREESEFLRVVSTYGVNYDRKKAQYDWTKFKSIARFDKKTDNDLTDYYMSFRAMCKKVCNAKMNEDEGTYTLAQTDQYLTMFNYISIVIEYIKIFASYKLSHLANIIHVTIDVPVDQLSPAKARQILDRVDLLSKIREEILSHPHLEERLSLCQPSGDTPDWWQFGKHDKELLLGAAKHGLGRTDITILNDPDFSFHKLLTRGIYAGTQTPKTMDNCEKAIKIESREDILKFDKDEILVKLEKGEGTLKIEKVGAKKDKDQVIGDKKFENPESEKSQVELTIVKAEAKPEEKSINNSLTITTVTKSGSMSSDVENITVKSEEKNDLAIEPIKCESTKTNQTSASKSSDEKSAKETNTESTESPAIVEVEMEEKTQEKEVEQKTDSAEKSEELQAQDSVTETTEKNEKNTDAKEKENIEKNTETAEPAAEDDNKNAKPDNAKEEAESQDVKSTTDVVREKTKVCQIEDKCSVQAAELKAMFPDLEVIQPLSRLPQIDTFVLRDKTMDYNNEPTVVQLLAHGCGSASIKWPKVN